MRRGVKACWLIIVCLALLLPATVGAQYNRPVGTAEVSDDVDAAFDGAMVIDLDAMTVLYAKGEDEEFSPVGGAVNLMSAYVTAKEADFEQEIPVTDEVDDLADNVRKLDLESGDRWLVKDLTAAMMLHGAQDAAVTLAGHVADSQAACVDLMNSYASLLGMTGTRYADALGNYDDEQTTTVADMALLCMAALEDRTLSGLITAGEHIAVNGTEIKSRMAVMDSGSDGYDGRIKGIGEGSTASSGTNLLMYMEDDRRLLFVGFTEEDDIEGAEEAAVEALDFFLEAYAPVDVTAQVQALLDGAVIVAESGAQVVPAVAEGTCFVYAASDTADSLADGGLELGRLPELQYAPQAGEVIGSVPIMYEGESIAQAPLLAQEVTLPEPDDETPGLRPTATPEGSDIPVYTDADWLGARKEPTWLDQYGFYLVTGCVVVLAAIVLLAAYLIKRKMR